MQQRKASSQQQETILWKERKGSHPLKIYFMKKIHKKKGGGNQQQEISNRKSFSGNGKKCKCSATHPKEGGQLIFIPQFLRLKMGPEGFIERNRDTNGRKTLQEFETSLTLSGLCLFLDFLYSNLLVFQTFSLLGKPSF